MPRIPNDRAREWALRLGELSQEFVSEERGGETTFGLLVALYPTDRPHLPDPKEDEVSTPLGRNYWKLWIASVISNFGDGVAFIAYPWLASAITHDPVQIALVAVATRLPWLVFSLPAGVITDRVDRRKLVAWMDVVRFLITLGVALDRARRSGPTGHAPRRSPHGTAALPESSTLLLVMIYAASLLLGAAEVLRDNSAQTLMPAIVVEENLERANGRLWGAEQVMNSFVGPPVGGFLLAIAFSLPFFVDAGTFAVAAALVFMIGGEFRAKQGETRARRTDIVPDRDEGGCPLALASPTIPADGDLAWG